MNIQRCPRRSSRVSPGEFTNFKMPISVTSSTQVIGVHKSGPGIGGRPKKAGGATPTTTYGCDRMLSNRPTTAGSRPKARVHNPLEITATRGAPGRSSSGASNRPSTGCTPRNRK